MPDRKESLLNLTKNDKVPFTQSHNESEMNGSLTERKNKDDNNLNSIVG